MRQPRRYARIIGLALGIAALLLEVWPVAQAWALPINAPLAQTLFPGFSLFVPRVSFSRALRLQERGEATADPLDRTVTAHVESIDIVYAAIHDFSLIATIPYVTKSFRFTDASGNRQEVTSTGFGDVPVLGVYRFLRKDWLGGSLQLAAVGGLKLPTGSDAERDERLRPLLGTDRLPSELQPGSGSVDFLFGLPAMLSLKWFTFYGDVLYKVNSEANDVRFGNVLRYDLAVDYRRLSLFGRDLFLVLELNGLLQERATRNGQRVEDSGGHFLFLSPGLQLFPTPTLLLETSIQIPVVRRNFGTQLVPEYNVLFGLRYLFPTALSR